MSWFKGLLAAALLLASCGFTPVYGPGGTGNALQNKVFVTEIRSRDGFLLVGNLEQRLGRSEAPEFDLIVNLTTWAAGLGIDDAGNTTRFNMNGQVSYALRSRATGTDVQAGTVSGFTSYSGTGNTVEGLASEEDARERLMVILADNLMLRLLSAEIPA